MSSNNQSMNERKFDKIFENYRGIRSSGKNMTEIEKRIKDFAVNYRTEITRLTTIVGILGGFSDTSFDASATGKYKDYTGLEKYDLALGNNILFDSDHLYEHAEWIKDTGRFKTKVLKNLPSSTANKNIITWKTINPFDDNIGSPQSLVEFFFNMMMAYRADLLSTKESAAAGPAAARLNDWKIPLPTEWTESGGILDKMMTNNQNRENLKNWGVEVSAILNPEYVLNSQYYEYDGNHSVNRHTCIENGGVLIPYFLPIDPRNNNWQNIVANNNFQVNDFQFGNNALLYSVVSNTSVESGNVSVYLTNNNPNNNPNYQNIPISPMSAYMTNKTRLLYDIIYSQGIYNVLDQTIYGQPGIESGQQQGQLPPPQQGRGFVNNNGILFYHNNNQNYQNFMPIHQAQQTTLMGALQAQQNFDQRMYKRWDTGRTFYNTTILRTITNPKSFITGAQANKQKIDTTDNLVKVFNQYIIDNPELNDNDKKLNLFLFSNGLSNSTIYQPGAPANMNDWIKFTDVSNPIGLFNVYNHRNNDVVVNALIQLETLLTKAEITTIITTFVDQIFTNIAPTHYYSQLNQAKKNDCKTNFQTRLINSILTVKEALFMNDISKKFTTINTYKDVTSPLYNQNARNPAPTAISDDREIYEKMGQYIPIASTENFRQAFIEMMNKAILTVEAEKYSWDEVDKTKYNYNDLTQVATSSGGDLSKLVKLDVSSILEMKVTDNTSFIHYLQECLDSKKSLVNNISEKGVDVGGLVQDITLKDTVTNIKNYMRTTQIRKADIFDKLKNIESKYVAYGETELTGERLKEIGEIETMLNENILAKIRTGQFIEKSTITNYIRLILERVRDILQVYVNEEKRLADEIKVRQTQLRTGYSALKTNITAPEVARRRSIEELKTVVSETRSLTEQMNLNKSKATHYVEDLIEKLMNLGKPVPGTSPTADREVAIIVSSVIDKIWEMTRKAGIHRRIRVANINTKLENIYYFLDKIRDSVNFNIGGPQIARRMSGESNLDSVGLWVLYQNLGMTHMFDLLSGRRVKNIQFKSTIDKLYEDDKLYGIIIGQTSASQTKQPDTLYYVSRTPPENVSYRTEEGRRVLITYMKQFFTGYGTKMGFWQKMTDGRRDKILENLGCVGGIRGCSEIFKTKEEVQTKLEELIDLKAITSNTKLVIGGGTKRRIKRKSLVYKRKTAGASKKPAKKKPAPTKKKVNKKKVKTMKKKRSVGKSVLKHMKKLLFN